MVMEVVTRERHRAGAGHRVKEVLRAESVLGLPPLGDWLVSLLDTEVSSVWSYSSITRLSSSPALLCWPGLAHSPSKAENSLAGRSDGRQCLEGPRVSGLV